MVHTRHHADTCGTWVRVKRGEGIQRGVGGEVVLGVELGPNMRRQRPDHKHICVMPDVYLLSTLTFWSIAVTQTAGLRVRWHHRVGGSKHCKYNCVYTKIGRYPGDLT